MDKQTYKEMIVQSEVAQRMIGTVSPIYEDSYVGCWLFEDIGREWERLWKIIDEMPDQLFPQTTTWLLDMWEERYGITPNVGDDDDTRRRRILEAEAPPQPFTPWTLDRYVYAYCKRHAVVDEHVGPYTFRVTIVNEQDSGPLDLTKVRLWIIKHKHSHMSFETRMESDSNIQIKAETAYWKFRYRQAGTEPHRNVVVEIIPDEIEVETAGTGYAYSVPPTGTENTGIIPSPNNSAGADHREATISSNARAYGLRYTPCGVTNAGGGIL